MDESRTEDRVEVPASARRGGVHAIADVVEELRQHYLEPRTEVTVVEPEEEALAV